MRDAIFLFAQKAASIILLSQTSFVCLFCAGAGLVVVSDCPEWHGGGRRYSIFDSTFKAVMLIYLLAVQRELHRFFIGFYKFNGLFEL